MLLSLSAVPDMGSRSGKPPLNPTQPSVVVKTASKEVAAFCWWEEVGDPADGVPQALDGALRGFAQQRLVLGESLLDRVQIGTVGGQMDELCPSGSDCLGDAGNFVAAQIIEQDNVAGRQRRHQHLFDISAKPLAVDGTLKHIGRADPGRP